MTDKPDLAIEPEDDNQPIKDSDNAKERKRLKCASKQKKWRNNLQAPILQALAHFLSCFSMPALLSQPLIPALSQRPVSVLFYCSVSVSSCLPVPILSRSLVLALSSLPIAG